MASKKHLRLVNQGAERWNAWRRKNPEARPDLSGAYLRSTDLENTDPNLRTDEVTSIGYEIINLRTHTPIAPLSVFLSYTRKDSPFVDKLAQSLDGDGIRSWRDTHNLTSGPWEEQIDRAVGLQNAVVLVLSKESIGSKWVTAEVERAQEVREELEEKSGGPVHVLCPVALDKSWETDKSWPRVLRMEVQRYNILDFSRWKDDAAFEPQYQKLKEGLGIFYSSEIEEG